VGERGEATFVNLCDRLPPVVSYYSDGHALYQWLPRTHHNVGKGGKVDRNQGIHPILRDRLYRLQRRTKGYNKSLWMLRASIARICIHVGWV